MPSRKVAAQRRNVRALHNKAQASFSGALLVAGDVGGQEKAIAEGAQIMLKSSSQKSISTDEGSSSSGCSSSPVASDLSPTSLPPCTPTVDTQLMERSCAPPAPLWVDNGLKGDDAAWLLVLPKFPQANGSNVSDGSVHVPKSPKDAVLLGPYVTTKNTFLDESRVGGSLELRQRPRAQSLGPRHSRFA